MITAECPHRGKWRGCEFKPRYDSTPPTGEDLPEPLRECEYYNNEDVAMVEALTKQTYVCDICTRCGAVVGARA